jgi:hypothetical protein
MVRFSGVDGESVGKQIFKKTTDGGFKSLQQQLMYGGGAAYKNDTSLHLHLSGLAFECNLKLAGWLEHILTSCS